MNTAIDYTVPDAEPQAYVDEVPATGLVVVDHGDIHDARQLGREQFTVCFCTNNNHSDAQHDDWRYAERAYAERSAAVTGGHLIGRELFAVVRAVKA